MPASKPSTHAKSQRLHHRVKHHLRNAFIPHEGNQYHPHALRRRTLQITGAVLIAAKVVSVSFIAFYAQQADVTSVTPTAVISLTNQARQARKIATLKPNELLRRAAESKARDMVTKGYFAHISPTKITPWYWFKKAGYNYSYAGENLAIDFTSSEDIIQAWLNSPSHRTNLLSTRFKDIGVATATGKINGAQSLVVVQMFGTPVRAVAKKSTAPVQTPEPTTTKTTLTATPTAPAPIVPAEPPAAPIVESPASGSVVQTARPTFVGRAEPGSTIIVTSADQQIARGVVPASGVYSLEMTQPLPEGEQSVTFVAQARDLTSVATPIGLTVDTQPPAVSAEQVTVVRSLIVAEGYDLIVPVSADVTKMTASSGGVTTELSRQGAVFVGRVAIDDRGVTAGSLRLDVSDVAGNSISLSLVNADRFRTGVSAAESGPAAKALQMLFASRAFLIAFFALVLLVGLINVSMNWRRHHHPAVLGLLLLAYVAGSLALL